MSLISVLSDCTTH